MMLFVTAALFVIAGAAIVRRMRIDGPLERALYAAVAGLALWIASTWILALTHTLTIVALVSRLVVLVIVAIFTLRETRAQTRVSVLHSVFAPVAIWIVYVLWRGAVLPPVSHDALAYHLPKATLYWQRHGFAYFDFLNPAIRTLPINYELLLTEVIAWSGTDKLTEWVSVLMYLLFALAAGAMAERWWGGRIGSLVALLCACGVPVVLLHSGAHKNDLMVAGLMAAALVAIGRWISDGERGALYLCVIAVAMAVGTKPQAGILGVVLAPVILWLLRRQPRHIAVLIAVSIVAFLLLGGAVYVVNYAHEHSILNAKDVGAQQVEIVPYGDWRNLWQGPYVLLAAPFSFNRFALPVPWESRPWFWRRYEIYFSELGVVFSIAAVLSLIAFLWAKQSSVERRVVTIAALITLAVMLPVGFKPHGLYTISLPRYALFIVPVVFAWTLGALNGRRGTIALAGAAILFCVTAVVYAKNDAFAPFAYFQWARQHPNARVILFDPNRAASVADRRAGPREKIAIDAGFGTWIQPAFGADLQRPVQFIPPGDGLPHIDPDAQYVVVDRAYAVVWGHPEFRDLSQARQYLLRGTPSKRDTRVIDALRADSGWEVVLYNPRMVQAVFHRRVNGFDGSTGQRVRRPVDP